MQIESLKVFRDLVETSSFSKAARSNSITQSAVSQQVRGWEERFGLPLIDRSGKQFALTREGVLFYQTAKKMIDDFDAFQHGLAEMRNVVAGPIRVSAVYSVGLHELPPYLSAFLRAYPSVNVHVEYRRANQVYEDVAEGASDLGLVAFPVTRKGLRVESFRQDRLVLICSARHRLAGQKEIPIASVAKEKFIGFEPDIPTRKALDKIFKENGVEVNPVMEYDNVETVKRAVEVDAGVAIVPLASVEQELKRQTLRTVEFKEEKLYRPLGILYKGGRILSPAVRRFLDALKEEPPSF
ncbi:MAG: LysR family transcriptional regulator [Verrucomicrobium sp.]|nr:LysR family transcriptional regulator [Verrucomicrobium sp.]